MNEEKDEGSFHTVFLDPPQLHALLATLIYCFSGEAEERAAQSANDIIDAVGEFYESDDSD